MTKNELLEQINQLGVEKNMKILVHTALSKVGHLDNGPKDLIDALKEAVSENGIVAMPAHFPPRPQRFPTTFAPKMAQRFTLTIKLLPSVRRRVLWDVRNTTMHTR